MSQAPLSPLPPVPSLVTNLGPVEEGVEEVEENLPARYNFGYSVADLESGDSKSRQESREGDLVTGSYSVADPDGRIRTVTYTADSEHGFQAKVTYDGEEGPVAIPFNSPTEAPPLFEPVILAKEIEQPLLQPQPQSADNDEELTSPEVKPVEPVEAVETLEPSVPSLFDNGLRLASPVPTVFPSVQSVPSRVFSSPQTLNNIRSQSFPQFFPANSPQYLRTVQGLFNQLRAVPSFQALLHNNLHQVHAVPHSVHHAVPHAVHHALPQGVAVRAGAGTPLDLSQFTFLSNGQVVG